MVTDEMVEKAIDKAVASLIDEHPMGHWRGDQVKEVARRAIAEAALSAAEPVALFRKAGENTWLQWLKSPDGYADRTNLYAAPPAPSVAVKALEWQTFCSRSGNCAAHSPVGEYVIQNEDDFWLVYLPYQDKRWGKGHSTVEEAKAAAQSDYEARIRSALSAQVQDVAEGWHVASNSGSVLIYCLKQDGWRKGEPVMVNDVTIRIENANRSSHDLTQITGAILHSLPAAPAKQEGKA